MTNHERAIILVKAWPQPSTKYGETVCCAGITPEGEWRRLFPIRFRHLTGNAQFKRWDLLEYQPAPPKADRRIESRHVHEQTLECVGRLHESKRADMLAPLIRPSFKDAANRGESLTLIRPESFSFGWRAKTPSKLEAEKSARDKTLAQGSLLERELAVLEPCPYDLIVSFTDASGPHRMQCGDWETPAAFFKWKNLYGEAEALKKLKDKYENEYARNGVAFAMGTMNRYPKTWMLLGIIRLNHSDQLKLI